MQAGGNVLISFFLNLKCPKVTKAVLFRMVQKIIKTLLCCKRSEKRTTTGRESNHYFFWGGGG